jgi:L-threonylcarbamoyladenylate synthase
MKQTVVLKVNPNKPEIEKIELAAKTIRQGGLVAFPTETVYGLGADALNEKAVLSLFAAKNRPLDNPPILHIENIKDVYKFTQHVPPKSERLMKQFWPGPLTLVFKRAAIVPDVSTAGLDTVAIRMPRHKVALALIKACGCPIAAPSANIAGKPSPTTAKHVFDDLNGRVDIILDSGPTQIGLESTVLDMTVDPPMLLRPGGISVEELEQVIGEVALHPFVAAETEVPAEKARSPGMKHRHYAPRAPVILVEGSVLAVAGKIKELADIYKAEGKKVGVLASKETCAYYDVAVVRCLSRRRDVNAAAVNLFKLLREFDTENVDVIIAEGVSIEGIGLAVMNRLRKASGYHIIKTE